jgi:hypothetical protein
MQWFPCGPDFVFDPSDGGYTRLSPSNEGGISGRVLSIAMEASADPLRPNVLYAVGGEGFRDGPTMTVFRKAAADTHWSCPGDALLQAFPDADPRAVATHPSYPDHAYVGTWNDQAVYAYDGATRTWGPRSPIPGRVRKLIVDPRPVASIAATILYAATDAGVYRSANNGGVWTQVLTGDCWSLAAHIPAAGSPRFYAGLRFSGVWFADTEPLDASHWTNLAIAPAGTFETVLVDYCAANPDCAYAWFASETVPDAVYNTLDPRGAWTLKNANPTAPDLVAGRPPFALQQWQTFQCLSFGVSPDSPGDGAHDCLIFGSLLYARSPDSGATWTLFRDFFHADLRGLAFAPGSPAALYLGCDGGLALYANATQASFDPNRTIAPDDRSCRDTVTPVTRTYRSGNRGLANACAYAVAQEPAGLTPLYLGCVDSGIAFKDGGQGWRSWSGGDAFKVAVARAPDGVRIRQEVWGGLGPGGQLTLGTHHETGSGVSGAAYPTGDPGGGVYTTSNLVIDDAGNCYAGGYLSTIVTSTTSFVAAAPGPGVTIPVSSTTSITDGASIQLANDPAQAYNVSNVTPSSFDINTLYHDVPAGTNVRLLQLCAFRNALDRSTVRISQLFTPNTLRDTATAFARGGGRLACATYDEVSHATSLWVVDEGATAGGAAAWTQVPLLAGAPSIAALAADVTGDVYVLFEQPFGGTPLHRLAAGAATATPESCSAVPAGPFGQLRADPARPILLWASAGAQVYRLHLDTSAGRVWAWAAAGTGLPGTLVTELAFTNEILRAATTGRGVWELDTRDTAVPLTTDLYLRRHLLDDGWSATLGDGLPHPLRPGERVWHWECVDIKIDRPTASAGGAYFQTDPDASGTPYTDLTVPPGPVHDFTNLQFDQLKDFGRAVPAGHRVRVHVQVQNRSTTPASAVSVWTLWTRPSGLLPALNLNDDLTTFDFWHQFRADGTVVPALPSNSRWKSVGDPIVLDGIVVDRPQVACWNWDAPAPSGHYCVIAIVHCLASPIGETTNVSVDDIVLHNKQLGQKNLQVIM